MNDSIVRAKKHNPHHRIETTCQLLSRKFSAFIEIKFVQMDNSQFYLAFFGTEYLPIDKSS